MEKDATILESLGNETGCKRLSAEFYARVATDPILHPLFPGKTFKCATEEFAAFLIQFLGGDEEQTQERWWLSLRESHARRFKIESIQRQAWLNHMAATLDAISIDEPTRGALKQFFDQTSAYVASGNTASPEQHELTERWNQQCVLDNAIAAIAAGRSIEAIDHAKLLMSRPSVFVGLLARMVQSGQESMIDFVLETLEREPSRIQHRFAGRTLLHFASGAGCAIVVESLLQLGADPNAQQRGGHTPLYCVANECASDAGPKIVGALVQAGAEVNACDGVMQATPLHMAARRGHEKIAQALLDCGAAIEARDKNGVTPIQRALNCRKDAVAKLLATRIATRPKPI